jgi:hypothetical protein
MNQQNAQVITEILVGLEDWHAVSRLNDADVAVCKQICPKIYKLEDWKEPIPTDIQLAIQEAKKDVRINVIQIWASERDLDPFLIGKVCSWYVPTYVKSEFRKYAGESISIKDKESLGITEGWMQDEAVYLLARWGKELLSFDQLREKAKIMFMKSTKYDLLKQKANIESRLSLLEFESDQKFGIVL